MTVQDLKDMIDEFLRQNPGRADCHLIDKKEFRAINNISLENYYDLVEIDYILEQDDEDI